MSVITAYKSDEDGRIFEDKKKYNSHLRKLAASRREKEKIKRLQNLQQQWWEDNFYHKVKSIAQLQAAILEHANVFAANALKHCDHIKKLPSPILVKFNKFDLSYQDEVSNSHSCPHDGVTNWGGLGNVPTSYPGWRGRFDYDTAWFKEFSFVYAGSSELWKNTRIHTGSGGGGYFKLHEGSKTHGLQNFGYEIRMYASDWPAMATAYADAEVEIEKQKIMYILKNGSTRGFTYNIDAIVNEKYPAV
jgi:hypothetical protein